MTGVRSFRIDDLLHSPPNHHRTSPERRSPPDYLTPTTVDSPADHLSADSPKALSDSGPEDHKSGITKLQEVLFMSRLRSQAEHFNLPVMPGFRSPAPPYHLLVRPLACFPPHMPHPAPPTRVAIFSPPPSGHFSL